MGIVNNVLSTTIDSSASPRNLPESLTLGSDLLSRVVGRDGGIGRRSSRVQSAGGKGRPDGPAQWGTLRRSAPGDRERCVGTAAWESERPGSASVC